MRSANATALGFSVPTRCSIIDSSIWMTAPVTRSVSVTMRTSGASTANGSEVMAGP